MQGVTSPPTLYGPFQNHRLRLTHPPPPTHPFLGLGSMARSRRAPTEMKISSSLHLLEKQFDLMWDLVKEMQQFKGYVTLAKMSKVMRRLVEATGYSDAIAAFREIENFGVRQDGEAIAVLMAALVKGNALDSVDHARNLIIPLTSICFDVLINGFCKAKKLEDARNIMDEMERHGYRLNKGCKPNMVTYTLIMKARCEAGEITQALEVYEKIKSDGCLPDEEEALKWLQKMEEDSCKSGRLTYSPLLPLCFRKNRMKVPTFLLNHMFKNDLSIDLGIYALLLSGFCESGNLQLPCSYFKEMVLKGMVPYQSTYSR
ncbi:hypothetical protein SLEP1_g49821 [Rubroshorea leprosula]|uniref:Pentatricopeptide repeat-containing protein n=1 Tax=Rubroshorea leprosula TaxID=152421 RepID=A0AAV5M131_9ROSI|nr:hypothetical protein SLEP1_g49821 [Rubroshorea leprosula]